MKQSQAKKHDNTMTNKILMRLIALVLGLLFLEILIIHSKNEQQKSVSNQVQTARIMANGDLLYHDGLYMSALQADGSYDFTENFTYVKPCLSRLIWSWVILRELSILIILCQATLCLMLLNQ